MFSDGGGIEKSDTGLLVCSGISGMLAQFIYRLIFSFEPIPDVTYVGLAQSPPQVALEIPIWALQVGNALAYSFELTRTIRMTNTLDTWQAKLHETNSM